MISVKKLAKKLQAKNWQLVTAESCTGGLVAATLTDMPGSSLWFERGFVTYSNLAKQQMLGVDANLIDLHGAVSKEVALAMAQGALVHSSAQIALAVTGVAGPGGGSAEKPVGTVWFAWATAEQIFAEHVHFSGTRIAIREQACRKAIEGLFRFC